MTAVAFDTLRLATALRDKAELTRELAEGFATAMADAMQGGLAIRSDLAATEARLLRAIESTKADILKWMFGAFGLQTVIVVGAIVARAVCARGLSAGGAIGN